MPGLDAGVPLPSAYRRAFTAWCGSEPGLAAFLAIFWLIVAKRAM